jgi:hypothetical protein
VTKKAAVIILAVLTIGVWGCGELRYSRIAPEAKDFHPRRIAVLPSDTKAFPEARGVIDRLFAETLSERKWFDMVTGGEAIDRRMESDADLRQTVQEYLAKRDKVNYSDPELSSRIGALTGAEALLLTRVDYWNHTTENDKKVGKVGVSIEMIEAKTGNALWTAAHSRANDYLIIKPELPDVARDLLRQMVDVLPH